MSQNKLYSKIELGDDIVLYPTESIDGWSILRTTIIKPNGDVYKECHFCERYFFKPEIEVRSDLLKSNRFNRLLCNECKK